MEWYVVVYLIVTALVWVFSAVSVAAAKDPVIIAGTRVIAQKKTPMQLAKSAKDAFWAAWVFILAPVWPVMLVAWLVYWLGYAVWRTVSSAFNFKIWAKNEKKEGQEF